MAIGSKELVAEQNKTADFALQPILKSMLRFNLLLPFPEYIAY